MVDIIKCVFQQGTGLGLTVVEKSSPNMLSNTVVDEVLDEPAKSYSIKPGDAIVSINGLFIYLFSVILYLYSCA